jgi:hypothetical protein
LSDHIELASLEKPLVHMPTFRPLILKTMALLVVGAHLP